MGQPPVQHPGKRSPLAVFNVFQAFDAKRFNAGKIYSFKLAPNKRFDFSVGVLLPLNKPLNATVDNWSDVLSV